MYYIGTSLGASITNDDPGGIELLRALVSPVIKPVATSIGALRPRVIEGPSRGLLAVFNDTNVHQRATISVPQVYRNAVDVYSDQHHAIIDGKFEIGVPFKDVAVFDLE